MIANKIKYICIFYHQILVYYLAPKTLSIILEEVSKNTSGLVFLINSGIFLWHIDWNASPSYNQINLSPILYLLRVPGRAVISTLSRDSCYSLQWFTTFIIHFNLKFYKFTSSSFFVRQQQEIFFKSLSNLSSFDVCSVTFYRNDLPSCFVFLACSVYICVWGWIDRLAWPWATNKPLLCNPVPVPKEFALIHQNRSLALDKFTF